jgi:nicotinate phosphoribosyltransferase
LDSGDLAEISKKVRIILDSNGLDYVKIFASGDLDEFKLEELFSRGAMIDAFGVGTKMGTSSDRPYLDVIYKLCETENRDGSFTPIMKLSKGKITLPGRKQVYRFKNPDGSFKKDLIALADEEVEGEPLLLKVMERGMLIYELPSLDQIRANATSNQINLPEKYKTVTNAECYPVEWSQKLQELTEKTKSQIIQTEINHSF